MTNNLTVRIEIVEEYGALRMIWEQDVHPSDVKPAFETIVAYLDEATQPVHVIVDLTRNPKFPLVQTTMNALPAYRHFRLDEWLVIGTNRFAQYISDFLGTATGRSNVYWFETEEEAFAHMEK